MNTFIWDPEEHPEQQYISVKEQAQVRTLSALQMSIHTSGSTLIYCTTAVPSSDTCMYEAPHTRQEAAVLF